MTEPTVQYNTGYPIPVEPDPVAYLLLIDSRVSNYQDIINAKQSGVYHIVFDAPTHPTHSTTLIKSIEDRIAALGVPAFTSIGLVQHNDGRPIYEMFGRISDRIKPVISAVATHDPDFQTWNSISLFITMLRTTYRIVNFDMMACALYSNPDWKYVIDKLTALTGVTVRASNDDTGATSLGGDWFLESHTGANLKEIYFTEAIENYVGLLYTASHQDSITWAKKLILIDNRIKDIDVIINSMNDDTYCLVFNYFYDTPATILSKLRFLRGDNRYILDNFYYEPPALPTRMDASGNHCTPCDDFDMDDFQLVPEVLESEYLSYTLDNSGNGVWPFYSLSSDITIQKPVFFQRAKIGETKEMIPYGSTEPSVVPLNYKNRASVLVTDLDVIYELAQNAGEIASADVIFDCVGIIQHTADPAFGYKFVGGSDGSVAPAMIEDVASRDSSLSSWLSFASFVQCLKTEYHTATLDLMACALYANPDWKYIIDTLAVRENIAIRASLDNTGSGASDDEANWVLETDNVSLTTVYFTDKIYEWKYVLATYIDTRFNALRWNNSMYASRAYDARLKIAAGTNNFTIEAWYYETTAQSNSTIVDMGDYNYLFQVRTIGGGGINLYNLSTGWMLATSVTITSGQWNHIAVTRSGSSFTFYLNGVARQTVINSTSFYSNNSTFAIGWQSPDSCMCNLQKTDSVLYDIRLWNVARTATEIQMNRNRVVPANSTGLVANYLCTDNGGTFNDRTANALHTTIQNYSSARWSNSTVTIPNIGFLINNGYSLRTSNAGTALNAFTHFDNITYTDFSGVDLSGVNFRGADLTGCNFTNANLTNTNFANAYLINAVTTNAITTGSNIAQAVTNLTSTVLNLDGVDDGIISPEPSWSNQTQYRSTFTTELWFKTNNTSAQKGTSSFVAQYGLTAKWRLHMVSDGKLDLWLVTTGGFDRVLTTLSYNDAMWHHLAATYNSSTGLMILYVDGVSVVSRTHAYPGLVQASANNTPIMMGSDYDGTGFNHFQTDRQFRGSISDVRIWNVVRSAAEIAANYQQRLAGNETGLLGYWKLNQGYGTGWGSYNRSIDSTSSRGYGTLTNMGASPSGSWVVSNLNFQPRISTLILGPKNGVYNITDSSFSFIDPSSNSLGDFTYAISSGTVATVSNGAATTKIIYSTSGAISIPTLSLFEFPEIASLSSWQIDISFTVTGGDGTWRALVGDMYNSVNTYGWGLWISANTPRKIQWSWAYQSPAIEIMTLALNTPYILTAAQSSGMITLTLRNMASTYNSSLSISNLVASYSFDSTSNDSSVNNNHLTNVGSVTYNTSDYKRGTAAARFNLSNYFQVSNDGRFSPDNFTLAFWIKPVNSNGVHQAIASCRNYTTDATGWIGWFIYIAPNNNLEFFTGNGTATFSGGGVSLFSGFGTLNTWVHVAITMTKSTGAFILYINGCSYASGTRSYVNNTGSNLRIGAGANEGGAGFFMGNGSLLDEFRIYNKVLTASEIGTIVADSSYRESFSVGANIITKGPVTIGGWQDRTSENFVGTISYVNVSVPTNQRTVSLLTSTGGTPATITATQSSLLDFAALTKTASLTVNLIAPTIGALTVPAKNFRDASFSLTAPTSDSSGAFTYNSSAPSVATVTSSGGVVTIVGAGTTTITATQAASGNYTGGSSVTASLVVSPIAPTIGALTVPAKNFRDASFSLTAPTSDSSGAFTYNSSAPSVATVTSSGGVVTIVGAGTTTITATQAASGNYTGGSSVTASLVVSPIAPTIGALTVPEKRINDISFNLTAPSSDSNGAFTFSTDASGSTIATVTSGGIVGLTGVVGTAVITATQAASSDGNYTGGSSVTASLVVIAVLSDFVVPSDKVYADAAFDLTNPTTIYSGEPFIFTSSDTTVASIGGAGGRTVSIHKAGSTTITAKQAATGAHAELSITAVLVVAKKTPVITLSAITKNYGDASFNLSPSSTNTDAGSGVGVFTITSRNSDIISIFDVSYAAIRGVNSTTIDISQSETTNFTSGSASVAVTVNKGTPILSAFTVSTSRTFGSAPFSALAYPTSLSNGAITYSSSDSTVATIDSSGIITLLAAGYVNFIATQQDTVYYNSTTKTSNTMTVHRQILHLVRSSPTSSTINKTYGDGYFNVIATNASNGGTITYETNNPSVAGIIGLATAGVISVVSVGTATITARRGQTDQYTSDPVSWTVEVARTTTTLTGLTDLSYNVTAAPFTVSASSVSDGAVTYSLQNPSSGVLTIHPTSGLVTLRSAGSAVIVASQAQGTLYLAPTSITATITVTSAGDALQGATITNTSSFAEVNLEGASLSGVTITNTTFSDAKMSNANLTNAVITSANFTSANLSGATLSGATITGATFTSASLNNADLSGAILTSTVFTGSDLSGANLTGVDASGASFANAKLNNVDMTGANIANVNFTNTSIKGANIADVSFSPLQKLQLLKNSDNRDIGQIIIPAVTGTTILSAISETSPLRAIANLDLTSASVSVSVVIPTTSTSPTAVLPDVVLNVQDNDKFYLPINESEFFQIEGVKYFTSSGVVRNYVTNAIVEVINYDGKSVWLLAGSVVGLVLETNSLNTSSFIVPNNVLFTNTTPFMPTTLPTSNSNSSIVYSSSNTHVATIDPSSGLITPTGNIGSVRFTATQLQNSTYAPGSITSNFMVIDKSVNLSLVGLNQSFSLSTLAMLDASSIQMDATDATAVFHVRISDMNNVFKYQTDAYDVNDIVAGDIKYYVFHRKWPVELKINPSHAIMNDSDSLGMLGFGNNYANDKSLLKHDFIRYIALRLFNTVHGVDLFRNEFDLLENSVYLGETVRYNIDSILTGISTTSSSGTMAYDASANKYLTNDSSGNSNLCRELMRQIAAGAPSRFYNNGPDNAGLRDVPFVENDTITFKLIVQAAATQNVLTGVSEIPSRSYTIKLVLKNTVTSNMNTAVTDSEMYPNSYPYSSSVVTYAPTSDSSGVYNIYSPPAPIPFSRFGYNGWYYTNSTAWVNVAPTVRNHIKWLVSANNAGSSTVADLRYIRLNLKIHNNASLPYLMIYTQSGSTRKYAVVGGDGSLSNGSIYSLYMNFNSYVREPAMIGYTNAELVNTIGTGAFANNEVITSIAIETASNAAAGNVEFTLASIVVGELSTATGITSEKEYGFEADVPLALP